MQFELEAMQNELQELARALRACWTDLAVVAAHAELQHFIEASGARQQTTEAPEGAPAQTAAADSLVLPLPRHFDNAHP